MTGEISNTGVGRIAAERARQIELEGYSLEHDAEHDNGALAFAAACYAAPETIYVVDAYEHSDLTPWGRVEWVEPWPKDWRRTKPEDVGPPNQPLHGRIRELEKAGALIAAEIDRLLAQEAS